MEFILSRLRCLPLIIPLPGMLNGMFNGMCDDGDDDSILVSVGEVER